MHIFLSSSNNNNLLIIIIIILQINSVIKIEIIHHQHLSNQQHTKCTFHPLATSHTTNECRLNPKNKHNNNNNNNNNINSGPSSTSLSSPVKPPVICVICKQPGHYPNNCPNKSASNSLLNQQVMLNRMFLLF